MAASVEVDMSRWHAFKRAGTNEFSVTLRIDAGEGVTAAGLSTYPEIMAMRSYLNENRIGSPPIGSNVNQPSSWSQPDTLGFRNLGTAGSLFFNVTGLTQNSDPGSYILFQLDCEQDTSESTLDVASAVSTLNNWLWDRKVEVTTDEAIEETRIGKPTSAIYAARLRGAAGIFAVENGVVTLRTPSDATVIGAGQGKTMNWLGGPNVGGQPADGDPETHTLPSVFDAYNTNVVHYDRDIAGDKLQLPDPRTYFDFSNHHALWDIHNVGTERLLITDPDRQRRRDSWSASWVRIAKCRYFVPRRHGRDSFHSRPRTSADRIANNRLQRVEHQPGTERRRLQVPDAADVRGRGHSRRQRAGSLRL